jgi:DNA-binding winged helix-turn-helix (wHTH) protein
VIYFPAQLGVLARVNDDAPSHAPIRFGVFELDTESRELRKQGLKVRLQEQPFQILRVLLEHPGKVVTREELQQRIWPSDTFVDFDRGRYNAIKKIRDALDDSSESPRFIETLSRRGYRVIAPVIRAV